MQEKAAFWKDAVKSEPMGAVAILISLLPFLHDVVKEYFFNAPKIYISCDTPSDESFNIEDGFLYYQSRCLIANQSLNPVSVASLLPVMLSGTYPYTLIGKDDMYPKIARSRSGALGSRYREMEDQFPSNLDANQSLTANVVFFTSIGSVRPTPRDKKALECSPNLAFERLSAIQMCPDRIDFNVPTREDWERQKSITIKEQIYEGYSYGFADFDGFGLELMLGDGGRYILKADLSDVMNYRCNEDIQPLACKYFMAGKPRLINIGSEPEYSDYGLISWRSLLFFAGFSVFATIAIQLISVAIKFIFALLTRNRKT